MPFNLIPFLRLLSISLLITYIFRPVDLIAQTYSTSINDSIIHKFIQDEIKSESNYPKRFYNSKKRIKNEPINWRNADWDMGFVQSDTITFDSKFYFVFDTLKKIFTEQDIKFLKAQYDEQKLSKWKIKSSKSRFLKNVKINYYEYSIPLFSKDFNFALFYEYYFCGSVCAYSGLWIYKWDGKGWIRFKYLRGWIS